MRKLLLCFLIALCAPVFAANKPTKMATQADLHKLGQIMEKQLTTNNKMQREAMQSALNRIQSNTQQQITLLAKQIRTLSGQTARGMKVLNAKLDLLKPGSSTQATGPSK